VQILCPAVAAVGEVLAVGKQPLVQVTGELRDAVGAGVVAEEMAGHADLAAAAFSEQLLIEPGPVLDFFFAGRLQVGHGDWHHGDSCKRTSVLAGYGFCRQVFSDVTPFFGPGLMRVGGCGHAAAIC